MPDIETVCVQCKSTFPFSEKDQEFFYQRNMMAPQRCEQCRPRRAAKKVEDGTRFEIVCDHCGKHDRVPFQPKVGRPVLCRECHEANRSRARFA
ncbi:MAG: zinc-ribbon domain containing protein [Blastocatellia bacterium]|nr:zinc-ribbon domain containing protein [Blastocatellia bacterium]